jgi:PTS system nitrogen regulatory IIA component
VVVLVGGAGGKAHLETLAQVARLASHNLADEICRLRDPLRLLARLEQFEAVCG